MFPPCYVGDGDWGDDDLPPLIDMDGTTDSGDNTSDVLNMFAGGSVYGEGVDTLD